MSVGIADVRTQISDTPRWVPAITEPPDTIGIGDAVNTLFQLRFPNFVTGTLVVSFGTIPTTLPGSTTFVTQSTSGYSVSTSGLITFTAAPPAGTIVATRYQATAFSDAQLTNYLARAQALQNDDRLVLKQVQFDLIDVLLGNPELLMIIRQGDYSRDPGHAAAAMMKLKDDLRKDLTGDPRPGRAIPSMSIATQTVTPYAPRP